MLLGADLFVKRRVPIAYAVAFLWPLLVYWRYVWPIDGHYRAIGNDFDYLYYHHKLYLIAFLAEGHFPLWSPSEGAGFPFYANPFTGVFYPLNIILAAIYFVLQGYTRLDHQIFTVIGISIFATGALCWLRTIGISLSNALAASALIVMNFRLAEVTRFPNAVHAAAWYPWILASISLLYNSKTHRKRILYSVCVFASIFCLSTAGYPYYAYYLLFLIPFYVFLAMYIQSNKSEGVQTLGLNTFYLACSGFLAALVVSPYLAHMQFMLAQTTDRGGSSFEYSIAHDFTWDDTLGSLLFPPVAQTEGWTYGGILPVILALSYLLLWRGNNEKFEPWWRSYAPKVAFVVWIALIWDITHVRESELFKLLWEYLPGFASLRVWGRFQIILLPLYCLLIALGLSELNNRMRFLQSITWRSLFWFCGPLLTAVSIALVTQAIVSGRPFDAYWVGYLERFHGSEKEFLTRSLVSALVFSITCLGLILSAVKFRSHFDRIKLLGMFILPLLSVGLTAWEISPWIVKMWTWPSPGAVSERAPLNLKNAITLAPKTPRQLPGSISLSPTFSVGPIPNWYFKRYDTFFHTWQDIDRSSLEDLLGLKDGSRFYYTQDLTEISPKTILDSTNKWKGLVKVRRYENDEIELAIHTPVSGYIIVADNWDPAWYATLNSRRVPIEKALGTFKAIKIHVGKHTLQLRYDPLKMLGLWPSSRTLKNANQEKNLTASK